MEARTQEFNCLAFRLAANGVTILNDRVERVTASRPFRTYAEAYMTIDDDVINTMGDNLLELYTLEPCRLDALSLQHLNADPGDAIKSEAAVVSFVSHGARAPIGTVNSETQHASNRRLITVKSCQAKTVSVQDVSGRSINRTLQV